MPAHRIVLLAFSKYFHTLFTSRGANHANQEIVLTDLTALGLEGAIDSTYTGAIELSGSIIREVLAAASYFQMEKLEIVCGEYLLYQLSCSTCLFAHAIAEHFNLLDVMTECEIFISENFLDVAETDEFKELSPERLMRFLKNDHLQVGSVEKLAKAVTSWAEHDQAIRGMFVAELLEAVSFEKIDPAGEIEGK